MQEFTFRGVSFNFGMLGRKQYTFLENPEDYDYYVCAAYTDSFLSHICQIYNIKSGESW